jgi:hypothetical protein
MSDYGINATDSLTEIGTDKVVVTGQTFARVLRHAGPGATIR